MSSTDIAIVKKFLNNPDDFVPESLAGLGPLTPTCCGSIWSNRSSSAVRRR